MSCLRMLTEVCLGFEQGIRNLENLEEYTGLRVLWLEGNGLTKLQGMEAQTEMRTLYAQENLIENIEGLDSFLQVLLLLRRKSFEPVLNSLVADRDVVLNFVTTQYPHHIWPGVYRHLPFVGHQHPLNVPGC